MSSLPPRPPRPDLPGPDERPPRPDLPGTPPQMPSTDSPIQRPQRPERPEPVRPPKLQKQAEYAGSDWKSQGSQVVGDWLGKRKKELPNWRSFHPQDVLWWLRGWWRGANWPGRAFGLLIAFLVCGVLLKLAGCGDSAETSKDVAVRSGNNPAIAKAVQTATDYVQSAPTVQSSNQDMNLTVTYQQEPNLMVVQNPAGLMAVDGDGKRWDKQQSCWKSSGATERPDALTVVLPLQEPSVRFQDIRTSGSTQVLPFKADRLGSWGPGTGQLQLQDGHPTQFTYQSDEDGAEAQFVLTYPKQGPVKNLQPAC